MAQSKKSNPGKLNKEQVMSIPEMLETKTVGQIAKAMGVSSSCISYWLRQFDKKKIKYPKPSQGRKSIL